METNMRNEIEELKSVYNNTKNNLYNKIRSYIIDILGKFEDNYIEFQPNNNCILYLDKINRELKSISLMKKSVFGKDFTYIEISFIDDFENESYFMIEDMDIDQCDCIIDAITEYIDKNGYKHIEEN